jgi:hypothetical protein
MQKCETHVQIDATNRANRHSAVRLVKVSGEADLSQIVYADSSMSKRFALIPVCVGPTIISPPRAQGYAEAEKIDLAQNRWDAEANQDLCLLSAALRLCASQTCFAGAIYACTHNGQRKSEG